MTVAEKIRQLRRAAGLTQTEMGDRLGVKKNAVSKWECGRVEDIPRSKIKAMAELFQVPPSYLIDDFALVISDQDPQKAELQEIIDRLNAQGLQKMIDYGHDLEQNPNNLREQAPSGEGEGN